MRIFARFIIMIAAVAFWGTAAQADTSWWTLQGWKTDFSKMSVPADEILSGGPPKDGIPAIDDPQFVAASAETTIDTKEPVIALTVNGETRAYPLRVLMWHEIANDTVGGVPVTVTYCPLCNASIVFERTLDGKAETFGTTGKLRNSDLIMYDRSSESWWQQFTGEAIAGVHTGRKLKMLPSRIVAFGAFREQFPDAPVLVPDPASPRAYGSNPYAGYDSAATPFLYKGDMPDGIGPMERVVVIRTPGDPLIVTLEAVRKSGFAREGYVARWVEGVRSALDTSDMTKAREAGSVQVTKDGADLVHDITFAFVAHAFHPGVEILGKTAP